MFRCWWTPGRGRFTQRSGMAWPGHPQAKSKFQWGESSLKDPVAGEYHSEFTYSEYVSYIVSIYNIKWLYVSILIHIYTYTHIYTLHNVYIYIYNLLCIYLYLYSIQMIPTPYQDCDDLVNGGVSCKLSLQPMGRDTIIKSESAFRSNFDLS